MEHSHSRSFTNAVSSYFHRTVAELNSCDQDHMAQQPEIFTIWPFTGNVCQTLYRGISNKLHLFRKVI